MTREKRNVTAEDLTKLVIVNDPQFSPDGKSYVFTAKTIDEQKEYQTNLYFQRLKDNSPVQWTFGDATDVHPRFSRSGEQIVFLSNRSGTNQLWGISTHSGEAKQITSIKNGVGAFSLSPDGNYILYSTALAKEETVEDGKELSKEEKEKVQAEKVKEVIVIDRLKYKSDAAGFHNDKRQQLVLYDVHKKTHKQLTFSRHNHTIGGWSPDSKKITFTANLEKDEDLEVYQDIYLLELETSNLSKLTNSNGGYSKPSFSPDGNLIVSFGHQYEYDGASLTRLYIFNINQNTSYSVTKDWDIQLGDAMISDTNTGSENPGPVWVNNQELLVTATEKGQTGLYRIHINGERTKVYQQNNHLYAFSYCPATTQLIVGISEPYKPGEIYLLEDNKMKQLTFLNQALLDEVQFSTPEMIKAQAQDGWEIQGWLLRPPNFQADKKYPFVLEIHGGPHAMYGQTFFHELQLLAAQGYVVLYSNPRGSHGYGQEFVNACRGDYGGKDYTDLMTMVDYVLDNYDYIDNDRLGVTGGSYGGFMTNWIVGHTNRFKAAVTQRSISNWLSFYGVSDIGFFFTKWEVGHNLLDDPETLWHHSPLKYADKIETPLLILHGEKDFRCPIEQAEQLFITMKHLGKEVQFVRFPGASHELSRSGQPALRIERLTRIADWFNNYL